MSRRALLSLAAALVFAVQAGAQPVVLDPAERAARDAARLAAARAAQSERASSTSERRADRDRRRAELAATGRAIDAARDARAALVAVRDAGGRDLDVLHAVARSAAQDHVQRLRAGPLGAGGGPLSDAAQGLAGAPASLDTLYAVWFALAGELAATASVARFDAPVTGVDGIRQRREVIRHGAVLLSAGGVPLVTDAQIGLRESAAAPAAPARDGEFVAQQVHDSGVVGALIGACALLGALLAMMQALRLTWWGRGRGAPRRTLPDTDRYVGVIGSGALLLGLLGTVVGLIHTFRALALYGGADPSLAAAGIAHALSTTLLGLSVAIALALCQGALRAARVRVAARIGHVDAAPPSRRAARDARARPQRRGRRRARTPIYAALGTAIACVLFFVMQWLTLRPLVAPEAVAAAATVARIDFDTPPPPPPPDAVPPPPTGAALAADLALDLPPVEAASVALPSFALPGLSLRGDLAGAELGGGALAGAGARWVASPGGERFDGSDLIPISSARPKYPREAARARVEGWVELLFTIRADGTVDNVRVIDAEPPGVFEQAAAAAMRRWLYAPLYRNGKPVLREATQLIRFRAADITDEYLYDAK